MSEPAPVPDPSAERAAELAALRTQVVAWERRALEAETLAEQLAEQLADAQRRLAQASVGAPDGGSLSVLDGAVPATGRHGAPDSDRSVVPMALAAMAVVALLVLVVALVLRGISVEALVALVTTAALGWAAWRTRYVPTAVSVEDGVVVVRRGDDVKRFDLASDQVHLDVRGRPGDADWRVRFHRRSLAPVDVDASLVEPEEFLRRLREHRPGL